MKKYVPYKYKCKKVYRDPKTGLVSEFNPRKKGDGSIAKP